MARKRCLTWERGPEGWKQYVRDRPLPSEKRAPYPRESVEIHNFWDRDHRGIVFHRRWDPGTFCDPQNLAMHTPCGHAMPLEVAQLIARACRKCWLTSEAA